MVETKLFFYLRSASTKWWWTA